MSDQATDTAIGRVLKRLIDLERTVARQRLGSGANTTYDPTTSGLTATDLQAAVDELEAEIAALGSPALDDLSDVNVPSPTNQDVLTWDDGSGEWIAQAAPALEVKEADGTPDVTGVTQIIVSNGTLTDNGSGSVSLTTGGGGGGGSVVLLGVYTASAQGTLDLVTRNASGQSGALFQSDCGVYLVKMTNMLPATDQVGLRLLASIDGGANWLTSYGFSMQRINGGSATGQGGSPTAFIPADGYDTGLTGNTASYGGVNGSIEVFNPLGGQTSKWVKVDDAFNAFDGSRMRIVGSGFINTASAVNALQLKFSSGNITSGTVYVYGYKNS